MPDGTLVNLSVHMGYWRCRVLNSFLLDQFARNLTWHRVWKTALLKWFALWHFQLSWEGNVLYDGLFRSLGSIQMRSFPFGFWTVTIKLSHAVCSFCWTITLACYMRSSSFLVLPRSAIGTRRGGYQGVNLINGLVSLVRLKDPYTHHWLNVLRNFRCLSMVKFVGVFYKTHCWARGISKNWFRK